MSSPPPFSIDLVPDRARFVVAPRGEVDLSTAGRLREALLGALGQGWDEVVVDLRGVSFMDSQGVHVLLEALAAYREREERLTMVDGVPAVGRLLDLVGVRTAFPTADLPVPG